MTVYTSEWAEDEFGNQIVSGTSLIDLSSVTVAELVGASSAYNYVYTYHKGDTVLDQGALWVYVNDIDGSGNAPPALPDVSNDYWELISIVASEKFTWIAYANYDPDTQVYTDFTLAQSNENGIIRKWIGIAVNQSTAIESTNPLDYSWSKFVGEDGVSGDTPDAPLVAYVTRENIIVPTDTNGDNGDFISAGGLSLYVYQGNEILQYHQTASISAGEWWIQSISIEPSSSLGLAVENILDQGSYAEVPSITSMSADTVRVTFNIQAKSTSGVITYLSKDITYNKFLGAVIDNTPPSVPAGLVLTSSIITTPGGDIQVKLVASWNTNTEADFSYYEVALQEGSGSFINFTTSSTLYEWLVKPNTSYTAKVRGVDKNDNRSVFSTSVTSISTKDTTAPSPPTSILATATFKNIFLSWTNPSDSDVAYVEIWRNTTNNSSTATKIATVNAEPSTLGGFSDSSGLSNGTLYYYWLKAIDTSGNTSTSFSTLTTTTLSTVTITGTEGQFSCASTTLKLGQVVIISGTYSGTGSITGYSNPKTYVISATNGTTTFTLVNTDGTTLTTTIGTPSGLTYTKHASAAVPAAVGTSDIIAGSITADRIQAGTLTGDRFNTFTNLPGTITVGSTGVSIGTVQTQASDPAARINAITTTIDPGKILISGSTTLSSWRNGTDATKIEGGSIAANTISANKLTIGSRGLDISGLEFQAQGDGTANKLTWTAGTIIYTDDTGAVATVAITAGNVTWSSGVLYIYWTKGGTTLASSTATGTAYGADKVVLATYMGGTNLIVNYGRTIIDGSHITTGTINGNKLIANSVTANRIDSRGLSIKDASGNIILAAGTALNYITYVTGGPPSNATYGATFGTNISGQITSATASTYIADAAIGAAQIGSITLVGTNKFNVKSAASGQRIEITDSVIKVYDASNVLRVKIGDLSA